MMDEILSHDVAEIKNGLTTLSMKVAMVYDALKGNELSGDGGLVKDINNIKKETKELEKRIVLVEKGQSRNDIYIYIISGFAGVLITLIITHFLNLIK